MGGPITAVDAVMICRGQTLKDRSWVYGYYVEREDSDKIYSRTHDYDIVPKTVGRITSFVDKHEKTIYEDDIVRNTDTRQIALVQWAPEEGAFVLWWKSENKFDYLCESEFSLVEVIGNIHDNPALFERNCTQILLDRDVVIKIIEDVIADTSKLEQIPATLQKDLITAISSMEPVETVPADYTLHSTWEINSDGYYLYCSNCGEEVFRTLQELPNFCPNCGARCENGGKK